MTESLQGSKILFVVLLYTRKRIFTPFIFCIVLDCIFYSQVKDVLLRQMHTEIKGISLDSKLCFNITDLVSCSV